MLYKKKPWGHKVPKLEKRVNEVKPNWIERTLLCCTATHTHNTHTPHPHTHTHTHTHKLRQILHLGKDFLYQNTGKARGLFYLKRS